MRQCVMRMLLIVVCLVIVVCLAVAATGHQSFAERVVPLKLWYDKPAEKWVEALPLGNGFLGAMVFGGVQQERIQFNEESLCTGTTAKIGSYQPFGDVHIDFSAGDYTGYRRELLLDQAIHRITYTRNGVRFTREYFISNPDRVMVMRIAGDKAGQVSCTVRLSDAHQGKVGINGHVLTASGELAENGMQYEAQLRLEQTGGKVTREASGITVSGADTMTIYLAAGTSFVKDHKLNFQGKHPIDEVIQRLAAISGKTFEQLKNVHLEDYQKLFGRVQFSLDGAVDDERTTTDRLMAYNEGRKDPYLEMLLFQYGRYLLISSSRPGSLPANLQGIWNDKHEPAWYSQYTTNINVQMNYWPAELTGLPECHLPMLDWIENLAAVSKKSADPELSTKQGWIIYSTNNLMGGPSTWRIHRPGSAWLSRHLWEHYAFNGDLQFLEQRAYPMLKELVQYWENRLITTAGGALIEPEGWSPEHGPGMQERDKTPFPGTSYDQQIVYDLFSNYLEAAEALNVDADYRQKVVAMRARLLSPKIGRWGQLQEWMEDWDDPNDQHRHVSHLFAVMPGRQISPVTTPALAEAALVSLDARGDKGTGWSTAWKISLFARLHHGNRAHQLIQRIFKDYMLPNLFGSAPPFQIDGNFGYTAGVGEMLLQSHLEEIHLLPALPDVWQKGCIRGLKARGNVNVDMYWQDGKLDKAVMIAAKSGTYRIRYGKSTSTVQLEAGKPVTFNQL